MVKNLLANTGDAGSIPGSGRAPGEENGNLLQYSCLGKPMDRGAWQATVRGVKIKSDTEQLSTHAHLTLPWLKEKTSTASILQQWAKGGLHQHNLEGWFQILIPSVIPSRLRRQSGVNLMSLVVVKLPGCR